MTFPDDTVRKGTYISTLTQQILSSDLDEGRERQLHACSFAYDATYNGQGFSEAARLTHQVGVNQ